MNKRWILLLLIVSLSFYCYACGKDIFLNPETNVPAQKVQTETASDASGAHSDERLPAAADNKAEHWTVKVAQQVLALAIWHGIKQTIQIIVLKRIRFTR